MAERTSLEKDLERKVSSEKVQNAEISGDPDQIREQIEETRHEMSETIDALQERLSVANISEQVSEEISERASDLYETAKHTVYDATVGKAKGFVQTAADEIKKADILGKIKDSDVLKQITNSDVLKQIKDSEILEKIKESQIIEKAAANPLPLFLASVGVGYLISRSGGSKKKKRVSKYNNYQRYNETLNRRMEENSRMENIKDTIGDTANSAYEKAGDTANSVYNKAGDAARATYETAGNAAKSAYQGAGELTGTAVKKAEKLGGAAREQYDYYIEENPLVIGAIALVAGALVGLAIPTTSYENKLVGRKRDRLLSQAKETAQDAVEKAKEVAGQAVSVATEEVKNQVSSEQSSKEKSA